MPHNVRTVLLDQIDLLFQGRFLEMLPCFDLPLAVQIGASLTVLSSPAQFITAMTDYRNGIREAGVVNLTARMTALELPRRDRFRVWADIDYHFAGSVDAGADQMIIYCRRDSGGIRVELVHCTRLALRAEMPLPVVRLA